MSKRSSRSVQDSGRSVWPAAVVALLLGAAAGWWVGHREAGKPKVVEAEQNSALSSTQRAALGEFVNRYFGTWSERDIDGYGRCFHPNARIWFGTGSAMGLPEFLDSQRRAHEQSPVRLTEVPLSWEGQVNEGLAHVRVHWELRRGTEPVRGYDFFTLVFTEGRWQIIALTFIEE